MHVVSDLHLGGEPGRQIFSLARPLARLIGELAAQPPDVRLALVVNGDLVDFLAEPDATYFDPVGATTKLDRIMDDGAFAPVFLALTAFAATRGRQLILTLGNHDIELALPWVREHLVSRLSAGSDEARGRIVTAFDGSGFRCQVGGKTILCVHGNDVDEWNITDYERLRRIGRDYTFRREVPTWIPNGGTQMVIDVINKIKRTHPFVDLLKPETQGAVRVLLAIDPGQAAKLAQALPARLRRARDAVRMAVGLLSDDNGTAPAAEQLVDPLDALETVLQESSRNSPVAAPEATADLMESVERRFARGDDPFLLAGQGQTLGWGRAALNALTGRPKAEVLREALEGLKKDTSFDLRERDETFIALDKTIGADVDVLISGHTHLERALRREGGGAYYNSGTWVRLIELSDEVLDSREKFAGTLRVLERPTMKELDEADGLVQQRPAVVSVWHESGTVQAELRRVSTSQQKGSPLYQPVAGSNLRELSR